MIIVWNVTYDQKRCWMCSHKMSPTKLVVSSIGLKSDFRPQLNASLLSVSKLCYVLCIGLSFNPHFQNLQSSESCHWFLGSNVSRLLCISLERQTRCRNIMSRRTDRTRKAANSDTNVIPKRIAKCLTTQIRSLVNFFSLKATLIFWTFCSASATHKVRQWPNIWDCDNLWPGIDPIEIMDSSLHNTNLFRLQLD